MEKISMNGSQEISGVIVFHHPYNEFEQCVSINGCTGAKQGEQTECRDCLNNQFGSGENGQKKCEQKRRVYFMCDANGDPKLLELSREQIIIFSKYIMRLLNKGFKSNTVITNAKIVNAKLCFSMGNELSCEDKQSIAVATELLRGRITV